MTGEDVLDQNPDDAVAATEDTPKPRRFRIAGGSAIRSAMIFGLAVVAVLGLVCGWLGYRAYSARHAAEWRAVLLETGRQEAINLTTIDFEHAEADVQRILDGATGQFYDEFSSRSAPFVEVVKKAQSKSVGTVTAGGIESMNGDEAQVMVAVSVKTTTKGAPDDPPRHWRMRMTVTKQGSDTKVAKVEFVP